MAAKEPDVAVEIIPPERRREKLPKEGPGPHGAPETYYTSRVLNSTGRYARFVKKLRQSEEIERVRYQTRRQLDLDNMGNEFFIRCDRKSLINKVQRRVELCLESYEDDLNAKKGRLRDLLMREEEENIRRFVMQAQAGAEAIWRDKQDRLAFLLEKRRKEHQEKFKATPIEKCTDVIPQMYGRRAKEAQVIQLYQMREKEARREAERETDDMWHELSLKECEALEARMEFDAIERKRRDLQCKADSDQMLVRRGAARAEERERLRREGEWLKEVWAEENRRDREAREQVVANRLAAAEASRRILAERQAEDARRRAEDRRAEDTWAGLCRAGLQADQADILLRKTREKEIVQCNEKLEAMRRELAGLDVANEGLIREVVEKNRRAEDKIRCEHINKVTKNNRECRESMVQQISENQRRREETKRATLEEDRYSRELQSQQDALAAAKQRADAGGRMQHQALLRQQIDYNRLLKERALAEEAAQVSKFKRATEEYHAEIKEMLDRPFYSDQVHPFMKQMVKGLKMPEKCPCSKADHCK